MLPRFLCLGAQKAGTTSIWEILNVHPDVCLASPRETQFFSDDLRYSEGVQVYESRYFANWAGEFAVGEKCPEYLYRPEVAERIYQTLGTDVRFIVTLRSPAQRAYSHYRHNVAALREVRTFDEALAEETEAMAAGRFVAPPFGYLGRGMYAEQLARYLKYFPREQILITDFERDICSDQKLLALRLYSFLGVQPIVPGDLPFQVGRPRLDELQITCNTEVSDSQVPFVRIQKRPGTSRLHAIARRLAGRRTNGTRTVFRPSTQLVRAAKNVLRLQASELHLSAEREQKINRDYFSRDIEQLGDTVLFESERWVGTRDIANVPSDARGAA